MEWRQEQIDDRVKRYGKKLRIPAEEMASIKLRPMRIGKSGDLEQVYIGGMEYQPLLEELQGVEARLDSSGSTVPRSISLDGRTVLAFFEEHESGPEWLVPIKTLGGLVPVLVKAWNALAKGTARGGRVEQVRLELRVKSKKKNGEIEETVVTMKGPSSAVTVKDFEKLVRLAKRQ